jgi:hypothetical protein
VIILAIFAAVMNGGDSFGDHKLVGGLSDWTLDTRLVRAFRPTAESAGFPSDAWPATVPAAAQLLRDGLELAPSVRVRETEPRAGRQLLVERGAGSRSAWAYFLRADTMHSLYTYLEEHRARRTPAERFHQLSHGQGSELFIG